MQNTHRGIQGILTHQEKVHRDERCVYPLQRKSRQRTTAKSERDIRWDLLSHNVA